MNEKNIADSLCDSIENNPRIADYRLYDTKSPIDWNIRGMIWKVYAIVQLKDKIDYDGVYEKYIANMNDFMQSFKFVHNNKVLDPEYVKLFTKVNRSTMNRGEIAYGIGHSPIIDQSINNWPSPTHGRAKDILKLDHIHMSTKFIIRPLCSSTFMHPETYDQPVTLEKHMNTGKL